MKFTATTCNKPATSSKNTEHSFFADKNSHEHCKHCSGVKKKKAFAFTNMPPQFFGCVTQDLLKNLSVLYLFINTVLTLLVTHRGVCPSGAEGRRHVRLGFPRVFSFSNKSSGSSFWSSVRYILSTRKR